MHRYLLASIVSLTALSAQAADAILPFQHTTGATLTMEIRTSPTADITASLTEGTGDGATWYTVDNSVIVTAGLSTAGTYAFVILDGGTVIREGTLNWSGTVALPQQAIIQGFLRTLLTESTTGRIAANIQTFFANADAATTAVVDDVEAAGDAAPDTRDLEPVQHVFRLKRSGDGSLRATNPVFLPVGATDFRAGWDCDIAQVCPGGTVIRTQTAATEVTATDDMTLSHPGHGEKVAKVVIDIEADATPTDDPDTDDFEGHWIKTTIVNSNGGGPVPVYALVVIQAEP